MQIALVGDRVGFDGVILDGENRITIKDIAVALVGSNVSVHTGPTHPVTPKPAIIVTGYTSVTGDSIQLTRIGDTADCGCFIQALVVLPERDLIEGA